MATNGLLSLLTPKVLISVSALSFETVHQSLAQLSGGYLTPVSFSFGWSGYAIKLVYVTFWKGSLMPDPNWSCTAVNLANGITRQNKSWILGRILRDYDFWKPKEVGDKVKNVIDTAYHNDVDRETKLADKEQREKRPVKRRTQAGLVISIFRRMEDKVEGRPGRDYIYYSGLITTVLQIAIAVTVCVYYKDGPSFAILGVTIGGTVLAYLTGALPQWAVEKWACRRLPADKTKQVALTPGNGAQHVIIVLGEGNGLDLEDLANGNADVLMTWSTKIWAVISFLCWAGLSFSVTTIPDERAWFLLLIGFLGSLQNLIAATAPRRPESLGLCLDKRYKLTVLGSAKVMAALKDLEEKVPPWGSSLLKIFFPQGLSAEEEEWWQVKREKFRQHERELQDQQKSEQSRQMTARRRVPNEIESV